MSNRFDAYLAGRVATEPTLGTTKDGKRWHVLIQEAGRASLAGRGSRSTQGSVRDEEVVGSNPATPTM
jgi:hypothetical protein